MRKLVKEFDLLTDKILKALQEEKEEEINEYIDKREYILECIKKIDKDEKFKSVAMELDLLSKEKEINKKLEERKIEIKRELIKINKRRNANNLYAKNSNYNNFFTTRV